MDKEVLNHYEKVFKKYGHILNRKRIPWNIAWKYEIMSDAIIFLDEWTLSLPTELNNCLRAIFHHRAAIICGEEEQSEYKEAYELGKVYFPKWRGYRKKRNQFCPVKSERLKRIRKVSNWKMEKMFKEMDEYEENEKQRTRESN